MTSDRSTVRRHPERGVYDRETIDAILDEALFCHLGFSVDGQPFVIPTIYARVGDVLYVHGSPASRMLRELGNGINVCFTATIVDGLVLARSVYNHSMNYRSAVVIGAASAVDDRSEKLSALDSIVEHVAPGRVRDARPPSHKELEGTSVVSLPITEASAKIRSGPPKDFEADLGLPIWAGVIPMRLRAEAPETDDSSGGIPVPDYAMRYRRP
jgi:hypothetical protein